MKPIKCENCKMFYDGDKYENCPHCKSSSTADNETAIAEKEKTSEKSIKKTSKKMTEKKTTEKKVTEKKSTEEHPKKENTFKHFFFHKKEMIDEEVVSEEEIPEETPKKTGHTESKPAVKSVKKEIPEPVEEEEYIEEEAEVEIPEEEEYEEEAEAVQKPAPVPSIKDAVKKADSTSNSADEKTVAYYNFSNSIEPVVGWIICVEGEYMGESFSLKSGRNNIGRSLAMDIALAKEKSVSRERHASITFEPNKKKFYIQSGESSGLTYVNDELIMMFTELNDYDVITLGQSKYVFLRLCGDKFSWDNYS